MPLTTSIDDIERSVRAERPDMRPASVPDGTVTIVFSDVESSTVLLDRLGDAGFPRLLAWHDGIVRDAAEKHRGYVVKSQGDGFMLAFPSAAFALRASVVMRDRIAGGFDGLPIRIRAGLDSGEAIKHDDDCTAERSSSPYASARWRSAARSSPRTSSPSRRPGDTCGRACDRRP